MTLTQAQLAMIERARSVGGGELGVALTDETCAFLVCTMAVDLGIESHLVSVPPDLPDFFAPIHPSRLQVPGRDFQRDLAAIAAKIPDADSYFVCLAKLHKSRLKYQRILETQPIPTMDQVGPRGLLQYGHLSAKGLTALLYWRKWFFDIDNRAGQETGYLFEPIIALAIGGVPASAKKSPIKRLNDQRKGRQVDCIKNKTAYEVKLRVTIAASGQGRWREELEFPSDCRASGYDPILVVLDPTKNAKLSELSRAFLAAGGSVFIGDMAWSHLEEQAGPTMALFIEKYVRRTLRDLLEASDDSLPPLAVREAGATITFTIGKETLTVVRGEPIESDDESVMPEDIDEEAGGP